MVTEDVEARAERELKRELAGHLKFNSNVWALVVSVLGAFIGHGLARMPESRKVCFVLFARLANDLRCIALLSGHGYSEQAAIVAASVFESAHTISYIRDNEARAQAWNAHRHPRNTFRPVPKLIEATAKFLGVPDPKKFVRGEKRIYAQLCWSKHLRSIVLGFRPPEERATRGTFDLGPDTSEFGIRNAWFVLQHSGRLGLTAVDVFQNTHATVLNVARALGECRETYDRLDAQAKERWGTEDPFEGEW